MRRNNNNCCYIHRMRLEKHKQKTWLLFAFAKALFFLAVLIDRH